MPLNFSIVVPVFDEEAAVAPLAREIARAFAGLSHEIIVVDDGSGDGVRAVLVALRAELPRLRLVGHARRAGQSRAIRTGLLAARGAIFVTLAGDGQNDPMDARRLAMRLAAAAPSLGLIGGERIRRRDPLAKQVASRLANAIRRRALGDGARDTGCGVKAIRREVFLRLPYFDHQHRFLPALVAREGYDVAFEPVTHRPRMSGASKYTVLGRLWASIWDLWGVLWLRRRAASPGDVEILIGSVPSGQRGEDQRHHENVESLDGEGGEGGHGPGGLDKDRRPSLASFGPGRRFRPRSW
jgi:glycosyltransferase involved in cell wall biosynthesis